MLEIQEVFFIYFFMYHPSTKSIYRNRSIIYSKKLSASKFKDFSWWESLRNSQRETRNSNEFPIKWIIHLQRYVWMRIDPWISI